MANGIFDAKKLNRFHPETGRVFRERPWAHDLVEKVVSAGGEIITFEQIRGRPGFFEIGYRPVGTKSFLRQEVEKSKAGQAANKMATEITRSLRIAAANESPVHPSVRGGEKQAALSAPLPQPRR